MNEIIKFIEDNGVEDRDIRTTNYNISLVTNILNHRKN